MSNNAAAVAAAKRALRAQVKKVLGALSDAEKSRQSALVTAQVLARPEWAGARSVALFLSLRDEPCTRALLSAALGSGRAVYAPRVLSAQPPPRMAMLRLHRADDADALAKGALGVREPALDAAAEDALHQGGPDLVLVPGVAFVAADGRRLGRGRGFYDAWLRDCQAARAARGLPPAATLALAFRQQLFPDLPCEPHDARVNAVVYAPE